jgi:hypothetical protein
VSYEATLNDFDRRARELASYREVEERSPRRLRTISVRAIQEGPREEVAPVPEEIRPERTAPVARLKRPKAAAVQRKVRKGRRGGQ